MSAEAVTREQIDTKIKEIYDNEKFKLDAYFFCGFPSGTPSEKLIRACDIYLNGGGNGELKRRAAEALIAELEAVAAADSKTADNLVDNRTDIREVLAHKELLLD